MSLFALLTQAQAVSTTYRWVLANDLSRSAIDSMRANLALNSLVDGTTEPKPLSADSIPSKIRVNEGDCSTVMYNHRTDGTKFDVIDLDPYGTASPFLDAAVQSVVDGGKLTLGFTVDTADVSPYSERFAMCNLYRFGSAGWIKLPRKMVR